MVRCLFAVKENLPHTGLDYAYRPTFENKIISTNRFLVVDKVFRIRAKPYGAAEIVPSSAIRGC